MAGADGEAVTSHQHFWEATTSQKFRQAKMATFSRSHRRGPVLQFRMRSFKATSSLNHVTAAGADDTTPIFRIVQPETDVAIRATLGDISRRCATMTLYSTFLRGEPSTPYRNSRPLHNWT
ncbi:hypothetical protein HPB52_013609 [Rhipicephalus sanguineus]|uniref:Uncharacterized protein n=1 Tax=Rhipicephalus sanguineus TaxID=34632 RepID=A0A9D4Q755_RHISA|nr:hypothetical protein HPB52_013609 [Rhipicephalus sanguineus]